MDRFITHLRSFFVAFIITIIAIATLCGFILVDSSTANYGFRELSPTITLEKVAEGRYELVWIDQKIDISMEPLFKIEALRQKYNIPLPPGVAIRLELAAVVKWGWEIIEDARLERMYIQSVQDE